MTHEGMTNPGNVDLSLHVFDADSDGKFAFGIWGLRHLRTYANRKGAKVAKKGTQRKANSRKGKAKS